ncbi:MAG: NADH-quinone oxidoreductase subunit C [Acidobacteriota bacterium]
MSDANNLPAADQSAAAPIKSVAAQAVELIKERFPDAIEEIKEQHGEVSLYVKRDRLVELCRYLRDDPKLQFNLLSDLTGVDWGLEASPRFEVVYQLRSLPHRLRLRLKVRVDEEQCHVPTITPVWQTANWHERETFDLFGIRFDGHPDLRKILTPEDLEGHPLRKDFPLRGY